MEDFILNNNQNCKSEDHTHLWNSAPLPKDSMEFRNSTRVKTEFFYALHLNCTCILKQSLLQIKSNGPKWIESALNLNEAVKIHVHEWHHCATISNNKSNNLRCSREQIHIHTRKQMTRFNSTECSGRGKKSKSKLNDAQSTIESNNVKVEYTCMESTCAPDQTQTDTQIYEVSVHHSKRFICKNNKTEIAITRSICSQRCFLFFCLSGVWMPHTD